MRDRLVAERYAKAFMEIIEEKDFDSILTEITGLRKAFMDFPDLIKKMNSYLLPLEKKIQLVSLLTEKLQNREIWNNLFKILVIRHRFSIIKSILDMQETIIHEKRNQIKVVLKTAHKHSSATIEKIRKMVSGIFKKEVIFETKIEPEIVGGFVAETESFLIDGSIRNNLIKFKNIVDKMRIK